MSNARSAFEMFKSKGMNDREAMFAMIDHFNEQHWHDRNRYVDEIKNLKSRIEQLESRNASSG